MPEFKNSKKSTNNNFNYLSQSQTINKKSNDNPMMCSISDKIKQMKEELKKDDVSNHGTKYNNEFKLRLERISNRGNKINNENINNNLLIKPKKDLNLNLMKNKLKNFENKREKEKYQKKNAFDELDDILNKFKIYIYVIPKNIQNYYSSFPNCSSVTPIKSVYFISLIIFIIIYN